MCTCGGAAREGPPQHDRGPGQDHKSRATVAQPVDELAIRRELRSWAAAAAHLNAAGLAAAVPPSLVGSLRRRGFIVWPCGDRRTA